MSYMPKKAVIITWLAVFILTVILVPSISDKIVKCLPTIPIFLIPPLIGIIMATIITFIINVTYDYMTKPEKQKCF